MESQASTAATENYISMLLRLQRLDTATSVVLEMIDDDELRDALLPGIVQHATNFDEITRIMSHFESNEDVLGYGICLLKMHGQKK